MPIRSSRAHEIPVLPATMLDIPYKACHDLLYISGDFRRLYPVGTAWAFLGDDASAP